MLRVLRDSTDTLTAYPEERFAGTASAATMRVRTPTTALPDTGAAATIDTLSASTNAAALRGAKTLNFSSDPGATPGRRYVLDDGEGNAVYVVVNATGTAVQLDQPLSQDYPSGATLAGAAITLALTAAQTAQRGFGVAKIEATIAGQVHRWDLPFDVLPERFPLPVDAVGLMRLAPDVIALKPASDDDLTDTTTAAWELYVRPKLQRRGLRVDRLKPTDALKPAHVAACRLHVHTVLRADGDELDALRRLLDAEIDGAFASVEFWYDAPAETNTSPAADHTSDAVVTRYLR